MKVFLSIILLMTIALFASGQSEQGILPIRTYGTSDYGGQQQVFDITTDSRGIIYASNNSGLMQLCGTSWNIFTIKNNVRVRAVSIGEKGRILVGGDNEFGYFDIDSNKLGILTYHSLTNRIINEDDRKFGNIKTIISHGNKTYFRSSSNIFVWDFDSLRVFSTSKRFLDLFIISDVVCTTIEKEGYYIIQPDTLILAKNLISTGASPVTCKYNDTYDLAYSTASGFRLVSLKQDKIRFSQKIKTEFDAQKDEIKITSILKISDNIFSVGTNRGIFLINKKGRIIRRINTKHGLKSNIITNQTIDLNRNLWVGTENGISKINILSPTEFFPPKNCNYSDRIEDIRRFDSLLYIITPSGLYRLDKNIKKTKSATIIDEFKLAAFSRIQKPNAHSKKQNDLIDSLYSELLAPCWDLNLFKLPNNNDLLLISSNNYVISLSKNGDLNKVTDCFPYKSYQSKVDPRRVYIGLDGGFQSVYYTKEGKWLNEGLVAGIDQVIIDIAEDSQGNLWLTTNSQGAIFIKNPVFENHKMQNTVFEKFTKGLFSIDPLRMQNYKNKLLFASSFGVYSFSWADSSFHIESQILRKNPQNFVHRISKDSNDNLWTVVINDKTNTAQVLALYQNNDKQYKVRKYYAKKDEVINSFEQDQNHITWFGGTFGLAKTNAAIPPNADSTYYTYITTVLNNSDTTFGGYYRTSEGVSIRQPDSFKKTFDYSHNSFTFYYSTSSPYDYSKLNFSWYLEGYEHEKTWGSWSDKTYKEYTNLNEGQYIFHVRAIDQFGHLSEGNTYEFTILPPWYRTFWAYIGSILFFIGFVWIAIRVSTRGLKKIIKAATAEIMEQKDQLEEKNQNIMDSIRYAQRIQEAVTPSNALFHQHFNESFVLWKPRDIVSGDFYWMAKRNNQIFIAAADCTGHGVPGAFMSIMGISFLNQIVGSPEATNAADTLNMLRHNVITALNKEQSGETSNKDGMDIALCIYDFDKKQVEYAGAYNSLYIYRNGELLETKADRMPIGVHDRDSIPFKNNIIDLQSGDQLYMFSDGYIDQFGGPKGKKFMTKRFKKLLLEITSLSMQEQKERLWNNILEWRGDIEQVDDIIIIGIRVD